MMLPRPSPLDSRLCGNDVVCIPLTPLRKRRGEVPRCARNDMWRVEMAEGVSAGFCVLAALGSGGRGRGCVVADEVDCDPSRGVAIHQALPICARC